MALLFLDIEVFEKCFSLILRFLQHCWRGNSAVCRDICNQSYIICC
ncbi:hypothetical protein [Wolbachia endosymbiont (group A) of Rhinocyllus conicus]|nr:hypothetical protein [Wolbachia endosymbiont (group A) of Rhinocyllus conicus]